MIGGTENTKNTIYIIDFGLARYYINSDGAHTAFKNGRLLIGTARYASLNNHVGYE